MRLGKRERLALRQLKRMKRVRGRGPIVGDATTEVHVSTANLVPSAGTSRPGANLLRYERKKDKPVYTIDREPRIKALTGKVQGGKVVSSSTVKRFANF